MRTNHYGSGGLMGLMLDYLQLDRFSSIVLSVLMTLFAVFSLVAGTAVWPVVLGRTEPDSVFQALFHSVRTGGLLVLILDVAVSFTVMIWRRGTFSFFKAMIVNLLVGWVVFMFFTAGHREAIDSLGATRMTILFWGCLSVVLSYVLAFLPAAVTAGLAKLAHVILDALL